MTQYNLDLFMKIAESDTHDLNYEKNHIMSVVDSKVAGYKHNFAFYLFPILYTITCFSGSIVFLYKIINV